MHARLVLSAIAFCVALDPTAANPVKPVTTGDTFPVVELEAVNAKACSSSPRP